MLPLSIVANYLLFTLSRTDHPDPAHRAYLELMAALIAVAGALWAILGLSTAGVALLVTSLFSLPTGPAVGIAIAISTVGTSILWLHPTLFMNPIDTSEFIEVSPEEQPYFFEMLYDLCRRSGSPKPHTVYLCPNANAGVFVEHRWRDLFAPPKRHLLVGLGLINMLTRDELRAVLAHEFGHLGQHSMRLFGQARLVDQRLEQLQRGLQSAQQRLAQTPVAALRQAITTPVQRAQRSLLFVRQWLQSLETRMNQHMEFDADRIAIEIAGSDALISALERAEWADRCFSQTLYDLEQAMEEGIRSDDLFYHQEHISERMRQMPGITSPPPRASKTHPSQSDRQQRARQAGTSGDRDFRSAWSLFDHGDHLRRRITTLVYERRWNSKLASRDAQSVQRHLDGEHAEVLLAPGDNQLFGQRFMEPGPLPSALDEARSLPLSDATLAAHLIDLTENDYCQAQQRIDTVINGRPDPTHADRQWLARWDRRRVIATFSAALRHHGESAAADFNRRLTFHLHLQDLLRWMRSQQPILEAALEASEHPGLSTSEKLALFRAVDTLYRGFHRGLQQAPTPPELHGLPTPQGLAMLALDEPIIDPPPTLEVALDGQWLKPFHRQWLRSLNRIAHLRRKSLGALLAEEREIQARFIHKYCDCYTDATTC